MPAILSEQIHGDISNCIWSIFSRAFYNKNVPIVQEFTNDQCLMSQIMCTVPLTQRLQELGMQLDRVLVWCILGLGLELTEGGVRVSHELT